jgi:hypothetical protein
MSRLPLSALFVLLAGATPVVTAHTIEGPAEITADPGGSFSFEFTYHAPAEPFEFGSLHWGPLANVDGTDSWADGFCIPGEGGWSFTETMFGQLIDAGASGTTIIEADACDTWGHVELVTTVLPNPVTAVGEPDPAAMLEVYPNPMRGSVVFELAGGEIGSAGARVVIFDAAGRRIRTLAFTGAVARWDRRTGAGDVVAPGVYFYRVDHPGARTGRLVVMD